jgi:hypothetical protein
MTGFVAFMIGVAVPVVAFVIPYVASHSTASLLQGALISPQKRFVLATTQRLGPPLFVIACALPLLYVLTARRLAGGGIKMLYAVLGVALCLVADRVWAHFGWYGPMLYSVSLLMAPLALVLGWAMLSARSDAEVLKHQGAPVLWGLVAAWCALIQFPFSAPTYFAYVAPLVIVSAVAASRALRGQAPALDGALVVGYIALALVLRPTLNPAGHLRPHAAAIPSSRGGIFVSAVDSAEYGGLLTSLAAHAHSPYSFATPDVPEVYFLSGLKNPTRTLYDLFDDTTGRDRRILRTVDSAGITAIVINLQPSFSAPVGRQLYDSLAKRFPARQLAGQFEVRWR